ncbi:hypothetical protein CRG98_015616 [Punica granatum]|uniref:Uncharacterized protein n=1 Tax=Punica granatum TaxID=22663 RepID=A0A2I0K7A5_PUNGR|nr:hypothetical protein CRG98_015616 [Punica granatum]
MHFSIGVHLLRNAVHLANPPSKRSCTPQVHWVGAFEPCSSFGMRPVHIANPSGQSQLYFSAPGSIPFGSIPTLLFCTGVNPLRVNPDFTFLHRGQSPSGQSRLYFLHRGQSPLNPLRVNPDFTFPHRSQSPSGQSRLCFSAPGSIPFGSIRTLLFGTGVNPLQVYPDFTFCTGVSPLRVNPDFTFCTGVNPLRVNPDFTFPHRGQSSLGQSRLLFCIGVNPDFTFLHRGRSPSGQSRLYFRHRGQSPSGQSRLYFSASGTVRVDPTTLGTNDHHGHLEGSLGYPRPPTLFKIPSGASVATSDQTCASRVCPVFQPGLFGAIRVCSTENSPNPTHQRSNPTLEGFLHNPGRSRELVDTGYRPRWPALRRFPFFQNNFQLKGKIVFSQFSDTLRVSMAETLQYGIRMGYLFRCRFSYIAFSYLTDEFLSS